MDRFVNFDLLKNPYNWIVVVLMTAFALLLLHIVMPEETPEAS